MTGLLLHACCGPCATGCVSLLREEGVAFDLFWHNPNIHPYTEYKSRREALEVFAQEEGIRFIEGGGYGLREFLSAIPSPEERCETCYRMRMMKTAKYAKENGYEAFSTTLLISPYQDHEGIAEVAGECASAFDVAFAYRDFRPAFRPAQRGARERGLYMQKYCGCIFSEEERYLNKRPRQGK